MVFENDVFDLDALTAELDQELEAGTLEEDVVEEVVEETVDETVIEETVVEETTEEETVTVEDPTNEELEDTTVVEETAVDEDLHKRNEAFKELRLEKERLEKEGEFVTQLAESYGMSVEELRKNFEDKRAKEDADKQGLNIEQYKKMQDLEATVKKLEAGRVEERFNLYADKFIEDKKLTTDQFRDLAVESTKMGFDLMNNPQYIDVAWKALNYDKAIEEGKQAQLAQTKKRRETSTGNTGLAGGNVVEVNSYDKEIDAYLKDQGIVD